MLFLLLLLCYYIGCSFNILVALPIEIFCFCEGMTSFELPVSKIRVEPRSRTVNFDICVQTSLLFAGVHVGAENVLIESYFRNRNGLKVNGSWIYSAQNCLEEFIAEFPNVRYC
jgi:hypothetical protein